MTWRASDANRGTDELAVEMDDEDKAKLARQGLRATELIEPGKIGERVKSSVSGAAAGAALKGIALVGRVTGKGPGAHRAASGPAHVDLSETFERWDADEHDAFDAKLARAATNAKALVPPAPAEPDAVVREAASESRPAADLAALRRSFPEASEKLALLVFGCADLLEKVAAGHPTDARKEELFVGIAQLLKPDASEALESFVAHVVELSRGQRE